MKKNKKPNYKGFGEHLQDAEAAGIPIDKSYLAKLAKRYNTPIPNTPEWDNEFPKVNEAP